MGLFSRYGFQEFGDADQIVGSDGKGEDGFDPCQSPDLDLCGAANGLGPAECFFNSLAAALAIETQLAPTLSAGDVVIMDNLAAHKSPAAQAAIRARGAWLLFLPPYSPDLNPIEMAFSKLKENLRATAARTIDDLWKAIGNICKLFSAIECSNYFTAAGYGLN